MKLGKQKKGKESKTLSLKTEINFAGINQNTTNWRMAIPGIILILIGAALFGKFGVADRFEKLGRAQARVRELQDEADLKRAELVERSELTERYYHYNLSGLTEEERNQVSRVDVADLVYFISSQGVTVHSSSLKEGQVSMSITADSLQAISKLTEALEQRPIVDTCSVTMAEKKEEGDRQREAVSENVALKEDVDAQLTIYLTATPDEEAEVVQL